jgi:hypothetical protein
VKVRIHSLRPTMLPSASSRIPWMYCEERVFAMYIVRSSGDSASQFGYSQFASTLKPPMWEADRTGDVAGDIRITGARVDHDERGGRKALSARLEGAPALSASGTRSDCMNHVTGQRGRDRCAVLFSQSRKR